MTTLKFCQQCGDLDCCDPLCPSHKMLGMLGIVHSARPMIEHASKQDAYIVKAQQVGLTQPIDIKPGEELRTGDMVKIGEDGRVYKAEPGDRHVFPFRPANYNTAAVREDELTRIYTYGRHLDQ